VVRLGHATLLHLYIQTGHISSVDFYIPSPREACIRGLYGLPVVSGGV